MANISIDQLANELTQAVKEYTEDVSKGVEKALNKAAEEIRDDAAAAAPKNTGDYAENFKVTKRGQDGNSKRIIWNKKHHRRVHLLEFGHAKVGGGRVQGRPHLRPAYDKCSASLTDDIKRIIRNGG